MQNTPLVSIIIPTYNRADVICPTIENVLAQTYRNTEIIVIDDGSSDNTVAKLSPYGDRIRVITQANAGPAAARNRGIGAARGEYVAFQDSDDLWMTNKLERQVELLNRAGKSAVCCLCNAIFRYRDQPEFTSFKRSWLFPRMQYGIWTNAAEVWATRFVLFCQTVMIRREVLERIGGFDESLKYDEDYDLPLRLALEGPWVLIEEPLTIWQQGAGGSWSERALNEEICLKECDIRIRLKILARLTNTSEHKRVKTLLLRELGRTRRELWRARLIERRAPGSAMVAGLLARIDRYCWAVYRRTPLYPKVQLQAVAQGAARAAISG